MADDEIGPGQRKREATHEEKRVLHGPDLHELDLQYKVDDNPPWYICLLLGFQHYLTMFGATLSIPMLLGSAICVGDDMLALSEILATILFVSGIVTVLQSTVGCRLPIIQGGTFAFLVPTFAILSLDKWKCPSIVAADGIPDNMTTSPPIFTGSAEHREVWQMRMREIQGAIILASLFQVVIGLSGVVGVLLRFIGPLAIAPTIALMGLSLFEPAIHVASTNWWVAVATVGIITIFSQYLKNVQVPVFTYNRKEKSCSHFGFPVFKLFPVILAVCAMWLVCSILTLTNAIPDDPAHWAYKTRTDTKSVVLHQSKWFRFPYPGQWGTPTFNMASVFGMLAGVVGGIMESLGDYYACAKISGAPPPPTHAINRGMFIEGIGCVLAGVWGTGNGTTSYSENIGAIGITKVGSRRVIQVAGLILIFVGMFAKFGAFFVLIPEPILGGVFIVMFGMITAVGISNLQFVDLNSTRNLFILGLSLFVGLTVPQWVIKNGRSIDTGNEIADQIITVLLSTGMLVGGVIGFILDNTVPGTLQERGILRRDVASHKADGGSDSGQETLKTYDVPIVTGYLKRWPWMCYVPISPTFDARFPCRPSNRTPTTANEEELGVFIKSDQTAV